MNTLIINTNQYSLTQLNNKKKILNENLSMWLTLIVDIKLYTHFTVGKINKKNIKKGIFLSLLWPNIGG